MTYVYHPAILFATICSLSPDGTNINNNRDSYFKPGCHFKDVGNDENTSQGNKCVRYTVKIYRKTIYRNFTFVTCNVKVEVLHLTYCLSLRTSCSHILLIWKRLVDLESHSIKTRLPTFNSGLKHTGPL